MFFSYIECKLLQLTTGFVQFRDWAINIFILSPARPQMGVGDYYLNWGRKNEEVGTHCVAVKRLQQFD